MQQEEQKVSEIKDKVELFISCQDLKNQDTFSKNDPYAQIWLHQGTVERYIGRTEIIENNNNPKFTKSFRFDYYCEKQQELEITLYDYDKNNKKEKDDFIGKIKINISSILNADGRTIITDLTQGTGKVVGKIIIKMNRIKELNQTVLWQWRGENLLDCDTFSKSDPYLQFHRQWNQDPENYQIVYQSEIVKDNLNPTWNLFEIDFEKLSDDQINIPFKVICYDFDNKGENDDVIGYTLITLHEIISEGKKTFQLINQGTKKNPGKLRVNIDLTKFDTYLFNNYTYKFISAIDYSFSNLPQHKYQSKHYLSKSPEIKTPYEKVIKAVGEMVQKYSKNKSIYCYGFGADVEFPQLQQQNSSLFPINGNIESAEFESINDTLQSYRNSLQYLTFKTNVQFSPAIEQAIKFAKTSKINGSKEYIVLLIITNTINKDIEKVAKFLQQSSDLPLSVILVLIGDHTPKAEKSLLKNEGKIKKQFQTKYRNVFQFESLRAHRFNEYNLANAFEDDLKLQFLTYMNQVKK